GQGAGQGDDCPLRRRVVRLAGVAGERGGRGGERDLPVVGRGALLLLLFLRRVAHVGYGGQRGVEGRLQVDVQDEVPDVVVHGVECLVAGDAGVVDQDVDLAEPL